MGYIGCNPDYYRDKQLNNYLSQEERDEFQDINCTICGEVIPLGEEILLHYDRFYRGYYCCDTCVKLESEERGCSRSEAMVLLCEESQKYSVSW